MIQIIFLSEYSGNGKIKFVDHNPNMLKFHIDTDEKQFYGFYLKFIIRRVGQQKLMIKNYRFIKQIFYCEGLKFLKVKMISLWNLNQNIFYEFKTDLVW